WKDGVPLFYDKDGYALLSDTARWYIGGLLKHAPAVLAFAAPTTNSYRRLVPGYEAPIKLAYSARNRSACVRIPTYSAAPAARRLEFRSPDPMCNPYLSFAACLMAGLDGVKRRIEPPTPVEADLVVVHLDVDARVDEREHDLAAQVLQLVDRRRREIALLELRAEAEVGRAVLPGVPDPLVGIDVVVALVGVLVEANRVEDLEPEPGAPVRGVGDSRTEQILLGLARDVAWVAAVVLERQRVLDVADDRHRRNLQGSVDERASGIREQEHVALVDLLEAADARTVEPDAFREERLGQLADGDAEVLPAAEQIGETQVDDLDPQLARVADDVCGLGFGGHGRRHRGWPLVYDSHG